MSLTDILKNNIVKKTTLPLALAGALFLSCGKDKISNPEPKSEPSLTEQTKILNPQDLEKISSYDNGLFVFSDSTYVSNNIQVGDILVSGVSDVAPYGFLRKVKSISPNGTRLETEHASLEEAIENGDIHIEGKLMPTLNNQYKNNLKSQTGFDWNIPINNIVLFDLDNNFSTTNDQITANGNLNFNYDYELDARIKSSGLEYFLFNNIISEDTNLRIDAQISREIDEEQTIYTIPLAPITFFLPTTPPFPIVFTPEAEINAGAKGTISLRGNFEVNQNAELQAGIKYENNEWNLVNEFENNFDFNHNIIANASLKGNIGPEVIFYLYGGNYLGFGGGISAEVNATSRVDANTSRIPWFKLYGGLEAKVGAELEAFSKTVVDYEATILETEKLIFDSGNENPAETTGEIAFVSDREIYKMNIDGTNITRLTNNSVKDDWPVWSPDGSHIAFYSDINNHSNIYKMNSDGSNIREIINNSASNNYPNWSPDGSKIVFHSNMDGYYPEIYTVNVDGTNITRLTNNYAVDCYPSWSPDGSKIVFTSRRDGNYQIYIMNATDGSEQTRLTNNSANCLWSSWSPDGSKIAFQSNFGGDSDNVYTINRDGTNQIKLTNGKYPSWSPKGTKIVFCSNRDGDYEIYMMNQDGSNIERITNNRVDDYSPHWRPTQ